jgi:phosphate transport system substrate-binding protein
MRLYLAIGAVGAVILSATPGCQAPGDTLSGEIKVDGSSTVYLITEAMATSFKVQHPRVRMTVGISGTGGGMKKMAAGEIDIADASRAIRPKERDACKEELLELQVAMDGLAVVIHRDNTWARNLTIAQLRAIWHESSTVRLWSDVDPSWPAREIQLYGAGPDSGTFDYFTEVVNGKEKNSRKDYQAVEDDNVIVQGVLGSIDALGYLGLAYYEEHAGSIGVAAIAPTKDGPFVAPTRESVLEGKYKPLSRPLYIYVKKSSLRRPEVREFVRFYLRRDDLVGQSGYVENSPRTQFHQQMKLEAAIAEIDAASRSPRSASNRIHAEGQP